MPEPETPLAERPWEDVERMIGVDEALKRILAAFEPLPSVEVPLLDAAGMILAEDVVADVDIPPFRNSAMDGYAVRAADTVGARGDAPRRLRVSGNVPAGSVPAGALEPGQAIRIMTGAPVPDGADAVVRFEETDEATRLEGVEGVSLRSGGEGGKAGRGDVLVFRATRAWDNVRPAGEDVRKRETTLRAGRRLRPPEIGMLAALNRGVVAVHRRPRVAILSTGDEVIDVGPGLRPGQIRNSNSYTLAAMVARYGAVPELLGIARDLVEDVTGRLAAGRDADLLVTSGGVSLGDYDMVKDVLRAEGEIAIWQVRMKPGKPLAFGRIGSTPLLGLPGNPVAAAVSFEQFGRAAIRKMLGFRDLTIPTVQARLTERIDNRGQRRHYVRARVEREADGGWAVRTAGDQGAGVLSSMARANGLLVVPEELEVAEAGMTLPVQMIDWDLG